MNKFEAKSIAFENGWREGLGTTMRNSDYRVKVPTGELVVNLDIGYELSNDNHSDNDVTLTLEHWKPSTAHPPVVSRKGSITFMTESSFTKWLETNAKELIDIGQSKSDDGSLP